MSKVNKDKVLSSYPHACAEDGSMGLWCVWDISHEERMRRNKEHRPEKFGRELFGLGRTEDEAWADAVRTIEMMQMSVVTDTSGANRRHVRRG